MNNSNRKPLVIITPKYLLHHRRCQSLLEDFDERSSFRRVICDGDAGDQLFNDDDNTSIAQKQGDEIRKVLLCSGKIWYDLSRHRTANKIDDVILVRLEQIFPFPYDALARRLTRFPNAKLCWVQEEPKNMGAWSYIKDRVKTTERASSSGAEWMRDISYVGRSPAASPATGSQSVHLKEAEEIVREAFK